MCSMIPPKSMVFMFLYVIVLEIIISIEYTFFEALITRMKTHAHHCTHSRIHTRTLTHAHVC